MQDCKKWNTEVPTRQFVPHGIGSLQQCGLNPFMKKLVEAMWRRHLAWEFLKVRSSGITPCQSTRRPTNFTFEQRAIMPQDYIYIYIYISRCMHAYLPTNLHMYVHTCINAYAYTHTHTYTGICTHTQTPHAHVYRLKHTHIYIYTWIHMHTQSYTHTHMHTWSYA